jgi:hypothetical protein
MLDSSHRNARHRDAAASPSVHYAQLGSAHHQQSHTNEGLVFYGGIAARVLAENTAALGAMGPVTRGRVDTRHGHAVLDVVDAQIFIGGERAKDAVVVRCTLRGMVVLGIALMDVSDVRRSEGGAAMEIDFSAVEDSASLGRIRRRHTLVIQSSRGDIALIHELYYALVSSHRSALVGPAAVAADQASQKHRGYGGGSTMTMTGIAQSRTAAGYDESWPAAVHGGFQAATQHRGLTHGITSPAASDTPLELCSSPAVFETSGSRAAAAELAQIQERRRQRQRVLVGDLLTVHGNRAGTRELNPDALFNNTSAGGMAFGSGGAAGNAESGSPVVAEHELTWCKWCNDFVAGLRHAVACDNRPVQCSWCSTRMTHRQFTSHQFECRSMPDYQLAAEQERAKREGDLQRQLRHRQQMIGRRSGRADTDDGSDLSDASDRDERRRAKRSPPPSMQPAAPSAETLAVKAAAEASAARRQAEEDLERADFEKYGRRCVWCKRPQPKTHDPKCLERRVVCKACHEGVVMRQKDEHRLTCKKRPSRSAVEVLGHSQRSSSRSSDSGGTSATAPPPGLTSPPSSVDLGSKSVQFASASREL